MDFRKGIFPGEKGFLNKENRSLCYLVYRNNRYESLVDKEIPSLVLEISRNKGKMSS